MASQKVIFIIPGFRQSPKSRAYTNIVNILEKEGYMPIVIGMEWKNRTLSQNTERFLKTYKKSKSRNKYILGFSYGAMIAFIASTKITPKGLILCSMSPYFKEDVEKDRSRTVSSLMSARYEDFSKLHNATLAKRIKAKQVLMLYGKEEARSLIKRVLETFSKIELKDKHLIAIKKTEHDIGDKKYLVRIAEAAKYLGTSN